jgi:hypothetical protein
MGLNRGLKVKRVRGGKPFRCADFVVSFQIAVGASLSPDTSDASLAIFVTKPDVHGNPVPHRLSVGQAINLSGAFVGGVGQNVYNGNFSVEEVTDSVTFRYRLSGPASGPADAPSVHPFTFRVRYQTFHFVIEGNIFDIYPSDVNSASGVFAVLTYGYEGGPPYMFPRPVIRENIARHTDGVPGFETSFGFSQALRLDSVENGIVSENIIDFEGPNPLQHLFSRNVNYSNNSTGSGSLVQGHDSTPPEDPNQRTDELTTAIEDAMTMAFL